MRHGVKGLPCVRLFESCRVGQTWRHVKREGRNISQMGRCVITLALVVVKTSWWRYASGLSLHSRCPPFQSSLRIILFRNNDGSMVLRTRYLYSTIQSIESFPIIIIIFVFVFSKVVLEAIDELFLPQCLDQRMTLSREDGYWPSINGSRNWSM